MKTQIVYYSFSGNSRLLARVLATNEGLDVAEIRDEKPFGKLKAYTLGCFAAIKGKAWPILPLEADLSGCKRLILFSPVWASNTPPAVNAFLATLPEGTAVSVKLVSDSGKSACREKIESALHTRGCTLADFEDIKRK